MTAQHITTLAALRQLYGPARERALKKEIPALCVDARRTPVLVIRLTVESVYLHCAKAFMRSQLWDAARHTDRAQLPCMGEMMRDQIRAFKGEEIEVETQAQMQERYRASL
jgi:uncharacterized protein